MKCSKCLLDKSEAEFGPTKTKRGKQYWCYTCLKWYAKDRELSPFRKKSKYVRSRKRIKENIEWLRTLKNGPCTDCNISYPSHVMDWDHLPENKKIKSVADMVHNGASRDIILAEIAKCELVCSNCHRIRTWDRQK